MKKKKELDRESLVRKKMTERFSAIMYNLLQLCAGIVIKPNTREMIDMYLRGKTLQQIADIKGCSAQNVQKVISAGFSLMERLDVNHYSDYESIREERDALKMALESSNYAREMTRRANEDEWRKKEGVLLVDCEMSSYLRNLLLREYPNVKSIHQLSLLSAERFQKTRGVGRKTFNEAKTLLRRFSYSMAK